jgi:pimeloyl-ACP methyl ester carboxylesterase
MAVGEEHEYNQRMPSSPILFIPGLNCTAALYGPQVASLAPRHDIRIADHGHAQTIADDAQRILAAAPQRFALVGLSLGGYLALEIMRVAPERVTRLALLDTRATADTDEDRARRETLIRLAQEGHFERIHGVLWQRLVHPDRLHDKALEKTVIDMMTDTGNMKFIRQQRIVLSRPDYRETLMTIAVPSLVLVGEQDMITPLHEAELMHAGIRGSELFVIPKCGHLSTLEAPLTVNSALERWLASD